MLPLEFEALEQGQSFHRNEINFLSRVSDHSPTKRKRKRKFHMSDDLVCKHCDREFSSLQALGGHQNAHKREKISSERTIKRSSGTAFQKIDGDQDHRDIDLGQTGLGFIRNWMMPRPETVHGYGGVWPVVIPPTWPVGFHMQYVGGDNRFCPRLITGPLVAPQPRVFVTQRTCVPEPSTNSERKEQMASLSSSTGLDLSLKL